MKTEVCITVIFVPFIFLSAHAFPEVSNTLRARFGRYPIGPSCSPHTKLRTLEELGLLTNTIHNVYSHMPCWPEATRSVPTFTISIQPYRPGIPCCTLITIECRVGRHSYRNSFWAIRLNHSRLPADLKAKYLT